MVSQSGGSGGDPAAVESFTVEDVMLFDFTNYSKVLEQNLILYLISGSSDKSGNRGKPSTPRVSTITLYSIP